MRSVLISTKPFIFVLFLVGVTVWSAVSLSSAIPLGTSSKRPNSKRANHGRSRLFQDAVSSVSFWLRSFPVRGWWTRWRCVRGWLMRLLWAYEHDFVAISPFLYERIGTLCRHPCWSLCEQRIAGWCSGRSEGYCKSLAQRLEAWLTLPSLSRWLTCTIRLGYAFQFARRTPKFNGVLETSVAVRNAHFLREEIDVLLAKDAIEPVPPAERRQGFYSPYFIVPKKRGSLRPILDLRVLNRALHKLPFKMRKRRRIIKCIQPQDWFAAIDLKDAYFHVSILLRHRPFLRFAFEGRAWQYRVLPFGLALSPRVFMKVVEGALTPLREVGVRILNYLDDWLILAQSREQLGDPRDLVLRHLSQLGLRVNWEKSKLSPVQRISFLGVELDSVSMTARLTEERAQAGLNCLSSFRGRNVVPLKQFQRLLGHMASAAAVTLLGLLHMRPLQHWLHFRVPRLAWRRGTLRVGITQQCCRFLSPWTDLAFLRAGVPLEQVSRHTVVTTDASSTGWGTTCNGQAASGLWTGPRLLWNINCLELWAVHLALR